MATGLAAVIDVLGLVVIFGVNTGISALAARFFRVRLDTRWGPVLFSMLVTPVLLLGAVLILGGVLQLGPNLGDGVTVVMLTIFAPLGLGLAFDYFWMPAPDEVDLPEQYQGREDSTRRQRSR
jgi:hypothetical protein